jgi:diacylglycerol kinase family enzyme
MSGITRRRVAAVLALVFAAWSLLVGVVAAVDDFPRGLLVLAFGALIAGGVWEGVLRRGWGRVAGVAVAVAALAGAIYVLVDEGFLRILLLLGVGALGWHVAARVAFRPFVALPPAPRPRRPVVFINPRSGDGRAARVGLAAAARERGIDTVELRPGDDLATLIRSRIDAGADAVAMAGGDGSQAVAAEVAAAADVPYACIPSGTRNHFALDLGVDRDDVVGALDALVDGGERRTDLGEVNGRVFVNNVSLGVYAEAVQQEGYRTAKIRTLLGTMPLSMADSGASHDLRWITPGGRTLHGAAVILVSNNQYRLPGAAGAGTRPAVDQGVLGITVVDPPIAGERRRRRPVRQWTVPEFSVASTRSVPAGVDGEAIVLAAPVTFRIRPGALRVRVSVRHPGASPSAVEPVGAAAALRQLVRIAAGRDPRHLPPRGAPALHD